MNSQSCWKRYLKTKGLVSLALVYHVCLRSLGVGLQLQHADGGIIWNVEIMSSETLYRLRGVCMEHEECTTLTVYRGKRTKDQEARAGRRVSHLGNDRLHAEVYCVVLAVSPSAEEVEGQTDLGWEHATLDHDDI